MKGHEFVDSSGTIVLSVSTNIPGLIIVPEGFKPEDARPLSSESEAKLSNHDKPAKQMDSKDIAKQLDDLTKAVSAIQADLQKLKTNA